MGKRVLIRWLTYIREGSIHTIFGGSHIIGEGRKAMKRYAREAKQQPITNVNHLSEQPPKMFKDEDTQMIFSDEDARWVHHLHIDALVFKVNIDSKSVHRVFVTMAVQSTFSTMILTGRWASSMKR